MPDVHLNGEVGELYRLIRQDLARIESKQESLSVKMDAVQEKMDAKLDRHIADKDAKLSAMGGEIKHLDNELTRIDVTVKSYSKFFWIVITGVIGALSVGLVDLLLTHVL